MHNLLRFYINIYYLFKLKLIFQIKYNDAANIIPLFINLDD